MYIKKVVKFTANGRLYYHSTNAKTNIFICESDGFVEDQLNRLNECKNVVILDTWYTILNISKTILNLPFIPTYDEAFKMLKEIKQLRSLARQL